MADRRIDEATTKTGHVIGATYRDSYWGGTYRVVGESDYWRGFVTVECVEPGRGAHDTPGERWEHATPVGRDRMIRRGCDDALDTPAALAEVERREAKMLRLARSRSPSKLGNWSYLRTADMRSALGKAGRGTQAVKTWQGTEAPPRPRVGRLRGSSPRGRIVSQRVKGDTMSTITAEARRLCRQVNSYRGTQWSGTPMHVAEDGTLHGQLGTGSTERPYVAIPWANQPRMTEARAQDVLVGVDPLDEE